MTFTSPSLPALPEVPSLPSTSPSNIFSDLSAFSNPFGAPSNGLWNISKGVYINSKYQSVIFFYSSAAGQDPAQKTAIDQISDTGGRRVAVYEYPYIDGQVTDDLGRKGETYVFNIKFYGQNYQELLAKFFSVVIDDPGPGVIVHPIMGGVLGTLPVRFKDYEFVHRYDEWNAVTIKATFIEDTTSSIRLKTNKITSPDSSLRSALQILTTAQATIANAIFTAGALAKLPSAIIAAMKQRLTNITSAFSHLLGQLAATFSSNVTIQALAAQSVSITGGIPSLTSGSVATTPTTTVPTTGTTASALYQLPPVFQVGFDPETQAAISTQVDNFVNSNTITPQQAVYAANQIRASIAIAINEVSGTENTVNISSVTNQSVVSPNGVGLLGNNSYPIMLEYRALAVAVQDVVQECISASQPQVTYYTVPHAMSLRMVAVLNNLTPDDSNTIEALNPYISSINLVPKGTVVTVPA